MIPAVKQAAALRYLAMAIDPKRLAKSQEAFRSAYKVDLMEAYGEAQRTVEAIPSNSSTAARE